MLTQRFLAVQPCGLSSRSSAGDLPGERLAWAQAEASRGWPRLSCARPTPPTRHARLARRFRLHLRSRGGPAAWAKRFVLADRSPLHPSLDGRRRLAAVNQKPPTAPLRAADLLERSTQAHARIARAPTWRCVHPDGATYHGRGPSSVKKPPVGPSAGRVASCTMTRAPSWTVRVPR